MHDRINTWYRIKWMFKRHKYGCHCWSICIGCKHFAYCVGDCILNHRKDESNESN